MNIVVLGPQGSGKSTQAKLLGKYLSLPTLDVGDFLRSIAQTDHPTALKIKQAMEKGALVDEDTVIELLFAELAQEKYKNGVVIDGAPRTLYQAEKFGKKVDRAVYLNLSDTEATKRLMLRGRFDDKPDVIAHRLKTYHRQVGPVLEYFRQEGILYQIDASQSIEGIAASIISKMNSMKNHD